MDQGVEGISLCTINDSRIVEKIGLLKEKSIPVVTYNSDLPDSERICFVGQDYNKSGRIAAELVRKGTAKSSDVLAAVGNLEFNGHRTRLKSIIIYLSFAHRIFSRSYARIPRTRAGLPIK